MLYSRHLFPIILLVSGMQVFSASFSGTPSVVDQGAKVSISFTINSFTDVAVFVEDNKGDIIRHLAAGVLGPKAPVPFTKNSLSQNLLWDKTDDKGNAFPGLYKVKIGLKLIPVLDRFIGENKNYELYHTGGDVKGMVADGQGNLIVRLQGGRGNPRFFKITHDGQYLRTIMPYPNDLSEEKLRGYWRVDMGNGRKIPLITESRHGTIIGELFGGHDGVITNFGGMVYLPDGRIMVANVTNSGSYYLRSSMTRRFVSFKDDGSCPYNSLFGPNLPLNDGQIYVASSPDGRMIYAAGMQYRSTSTAPRIPVHAVYRGSPDTTDLSVFVGDSAVSGNGNYQFNQPLGLATDAAGRLYVADNGNNRVVVYDTNGSYLAQFVVASPEKIQIHPVTGDVYVISLGTSNYVIRKHGAYPGFADITSHSVIWDGRYPPQFLLNAHVAPAKLYYNQTPTYRALPVYVITDNGSSFSAPSTLFSTTHTDALSNGYGYAYIESPGYFTVNREDNLIYAGAFDKWSKIDLTTGMIKQSSIKCTEMTFGKDGYLYAYGKSTSTSHDSTMRRYQATWDSETQAAFQGGNLEFRTVDNRFSGPNTLVGGMYIDENGQMTAHSFGSDFSTNVYAPDGSIVKRGLLFANNRSAFGGLEIDRNVNIFTMFHAKPRGLVYPDTNLFTGPFFPNPLTVNPNSWDYGSYHNHYAWNYGSVFKFPSTGGSFTKRTMATTSIQALPLETLESDTIPTVQTDGFIKSSVWDVVGPTKQYYGISPSTNIGGGHDKCVCITGRLGVDGFGRVYAPDVLRYNVVMLDNDLNEIGRFGDYGNIDQDGSPNSRHLKPYIPFGYPSFVRTVGNHVYVGDPGNHRIVCIRMDYETVFDGTGIVAAENKVASGDPALDVFPTPCNPVATIRLAVRKPSIVSVRIYSLSGSLVKNLRVNAPVNAGRFDTEWNGIDNSGAPVSAGIYMVRVTMGGLVFGKRVVMAK